MIAFTEHNRSSGSRVKISRVAAWRWGQHTPHLSLPRTTKHAACAAGDIDVGVASRYVTGEELSGLFFDKHPHTAGSGGLQTYPFASFLLAYASAREFVRTSTSYEAVKQLFFGAKASMSPFSAVFKDNTTAEQYGGGTHNQHDSSGLPVGWAGAMEEKFSGYQPVTAKKFVK